MQATTTHDGVAVEYGIATEVYGTTTKYHAYVRNTDTNSLVTCWQGGAGVTMSVLMMREDAAKQYLSEFLEQLMDTRFRFADMEATA